MSTLADRFWSKVDKSGGETGCWPWTGASVNGYGRIGFNRRVEVASRVAFSLAGGAIAVGMEVDHLCRNPSCVNPAHLEAVTHTENMRRKPKKTHCKRGHAFTAENTYRARGKRECRICKRANWSTWKASHAS